MKTAGKILSCLFSFLLFSYLILSDYPEFGIPVPKLHLRPQTTQTQQQETPANPGADTSAEEETAGNDQTETPPQPKPLSPEEQAMELKNNLPPLDTVLCFNQISQSISGEIEPMLTERRLVGMVVYVKWLTGDYNQMTTGSYLNMLENKWRAAIGGYDPEEDGPGLADWEYHLERYLGEIKERSGRRPTIYHFAPGEYKSEMDDMMAAQDIETFIIPREDFDKVPSDTPLTPIVSVTIGEDTKAKDLLKEIEDLPSVILTTRIDSDGFSPKEFESLLDELRSSGKLRFRTMNALVKLEKSGDSERRKALDELNKLESR